jgi:hypothetical protein
MAWPFTNVVQPNLDTGPGVAVPLAPGVVTGAACWLLGAHLTNAPGGVERTITITDTAGNILCEVVLASGQEQPYEWPFRPTTGVKWVADGAGVVGHIWGYT